MAENELIESVRSGALECVRSLVAAGADLEIRDNLGWTALCWAAGAGRDAIVDFLLESGADPFAADEDRRTPYLIALGASNIGAATRLAEAEVLSGDGDAIAHSSGQAARRLYCRAYRVRELRGFYGWGHEQKNQPPDDTVVFLHSDFSVTSTVWSRDEALFDGSSREWRRFCAERLEFQPREDFE